MQTFASLLRSCALLALFTGSSGQSVPAGTLDEIRVEFRAMVEVIENKNALKFEEVKKELEEVKNENTALRLELEDIRGLLQTQPRRTVENNFLDCINEGESDAENIYFDGCNVHVRSGGGSTWATPNGKGNLIIGYNEPPYSLMEVPESAEGLEDIETKKVEASRSGSHNLIIGDAHEYTSYGGIVTGQQNRISNKYSAVVGGAGNAATGTYSTVTGGQYNIASGTTSTISGGYYNTASGVSSSISGGYYNTASGGFSSVLGGSSNDAQGKTAVVTGGLNNKAIGELASVVGGKRNKAKRKFSVVTGA